MLKKLGFTADAVTNGAEAVAAHLQGSYDLIMMDCQMPRMDGYQATAAIRQNEGAHVHVPIIAVTAHGMKDDREKCLAAGMDDYLSKPIQPSLLSDTLDLWLLRR